MLCRVLFCAAIVAAVLAVVLLATVSPLPSRSKGRAPSPGSRSFSVYVQPTVSRTVQQQQEARTTSPGGGRGAALVFRHRLTSGAANASRTVGAAWGFALPGSAQGAAPSAFDMVHLAFDAAGLSGSLCVEAGKARPSGRRGRAAQELRVVGGTGAFAFAQGRAVLRAVPVREPRFGHGEAVVALQLELSIRIRQN